MSNLKLSQPGVTGAQGFWLHAFSNSVKNALDMAQTLQGLSYKVCFIIFLIFFCLDYLSQFLDTPPFYTKQLVAMLQRHQSFICWWFSYDVNKTMITQIMINTPKFWYSW